MSRLQKLFKWATFIFTVWFQNRKKLKVLIQALNQEKALGLGLYLDVKNGHIDREKLEEYLSPVNMSSRIQMLQGTGDLKDEITALYNKMIEEKTIEKVRIPQ